jgi:zinc D-Ala-D-Ala carboxypeptidase
MKIPILIGKYGGCSMKYKKGKLSYVTISIIVLTLLFGKIFLTRKKYTDTDNDLVSNPGNTQNDDVVNNDNLQDDMIVIPPPVPYTQNDDGKFYTDEPNNTLVIINKYIGLSKDFKPKDLVTPKVHLTFDNATLRKEAAQALEKLFEKANSDAIDITLRTGFRSYDHQNTIYQNSIKNNGQDYTSQFVALAGHSEHQTGLAADLASLSEGYTLEPEFGQTKAGIWIKENCSEFGFIIRYPEGKEDITGYSYEPWHIRYVGVEYAGYITKEKITLEEFFGFKYQDSY